VSQPTLSAAIKQLEDAFGVLSYMEARSAACA
jgi:hypothetical protein